jgi:general secretion pathway protein J
VKRRAGFTLLELVVALMIFGIVMAAALALFESGRGLAARAEFRARLFQTARAALQAIEADVRGAVMSEGPFDTGFVGTNGGSDQEPMDTIEAVAVNDFPSREAWTPAGTSAARRDPPPPRIDVSRVRWWIEREKGRPAQGLVRERSKVLNPPGVDVRRDEDVEEISRDVVGLDLRYYDGQWTREWDSRQQYKLPKAVEVTVWVRGEWRNETALEPFTTRFTLPVGAEQPEREP